MPPAPEAEQATGLVSVKAVFEAPAREPGLEDDLARTVLDQDATATLRYASLRRLEELDSAHTIPTASWVLREPDAPQFLKQNAVAVLWRAARKEKEDGAAREALEQVRAEHEALLALLDRQGGAR